MLLSIASMTQATIELSIGYDTPEGYAIAKDSKMYYAFFAGEKQSWEGTLELRGIRTSVGCTSVCCPAPYRESQ